jgi:hypothetical protein
LFPRPAELLMQVVTGALGVAGVAAIGFGTYGLFSSFGFLRLLFLVLGLPGAAIFLFCACYRERRWSLPRLGGGGGTTAAGVTWPSPTRPPVLAASAAQSRPWPVESLEHRGVPAHNPTLRRTPGSGSVSKSDVSGPALLS